MILSCTSLYVLEYHYIAKAQTILSGRTYTSFSKFKLPAPAVFLPCQMTVPLQNSSAAQRRAACLMVTACRLPLVPAADVIHTYHRSSIVDQRCDTISMRWTTAGLVLFSARNSRPALTYLRTDLILIRVKTGLRYS